MFRFIHAADLHLGNSGPSTSGFSKQWADLIYKATTTAFSNLIDKAIELNVDFVILAGDVLDTANPNLNSQLDLFAGLNKLSRAGIQVFMAGGNHDPLDLKKAQTTLPEGVHLFGERAETIPFVKGGVTLAEITGISFPVAKVSDDLSRQLVPGTKGFQIAVLHSNVKGAGKKENYAPSKLEYLTQSGFDYWALGHVHTRAVLSEKPHVVYPGTTQGTHVNETGEKGCYLVEVENDSVSLQFIPTSAYTWEKLELEAPKTLNEFTELLEGLDELASGAKKVYRLKLTGMTPLYETLITDLKDLEERFKEGKHYVLESVELDILPDVDLEEVKLEESLLGEFLREAERLMALGVSSELKEQLAPLYDRLGGILDDLDEEEVKSIINGSIALGIELFWRGESR